jgi:hypothetical protein
MIPGLVTEEAVLQKFGLGITVVRDDLLEGGSKSRFLPYLIEGAKEVVFGGPFCGGAPLTLSVIGRITGQKVTLFYAKRGELHRRQWAAIANGAELRFVAPGYMTNVQAKARAYAEGAGALFLPLGFDVPAAEEPFIEAIRAVRKRLGGDPDEVWCAMGSGMLSRCLAKAFPSSAVHGVVVGLASRNEAQDFGPNVVMHKSKYRFEQETKGSAPFPSCGNYDRKAWEICVRESKGPRVCFWNVMS